MSSNFLTVLIEFISWGIIFYMISAGLIYVMLFLVASPRIKKEKKLSRHEQIEELSINKDTYPISILVPAYNEEAGVVSTVRSLLSLNYPQYEIIVVNDGSTDRTSEKVISQFQMEPIELALRTYFKTGEITRAYRSALHPELFLIEKVNGGKADALNAGINFSRYPYFSAIDGDSILEQDALLKTMKPIVDSAGRVTATGGTVRIANGCKINKGVIERVSLPHKPLEIMQIIEYFRAFLIGRLGFSRINILLIISGAFGVFEKSRVIKVGGYKTDTVGEDMELIVRLHRSIKDEKSKQRIEYIQDPVCWTEAPSTVASLRAQRIRWQRGLAETLWTHRKMLFNPKYRGIGLFSFPYYLFVELLSAVFEVLGYFIIIGGLAFSFIDPDIALVMFLVMVLYGSLLSSLAVLLEEWTYHKYPTVGSIVVLYLYALTETFWYRILMNVWRVKGLFYAFKKKSVWGNMERKGVFSED
ncbi:cellulose synthase/poly-beta-1,6-N-acetylglucosamine synthase-like glycosyltransferase [Planomicrobium soli]|uniref:Cellulose synthase/poly-beta-1,6-N-acetylglucosamine synthase-like glycosyltransferase n=1 Tax=Planomicrobium soli TaxID=1176648 RepID=A0A2P8H1N0_9BACL|nr:glycosyltransferase [Planomicrobium soli]PSL40117.1 cellulose synthase/poly-beta-1,6-N-acetylglucosamine synthase-like glycosyltransferase [Planomicrobium soli]